MTGEHVRDQVPVGERLGWLRRTMPYWILTVVLLVVALTVGVTASLGLFTSSSVNPTNVVSAGSMSQSNSADNTAIMSALEMVPGDRVSGTVSIANLGDARGAFSLSIQDLVDEPGPGGGSLSQRLQVEVVDTGSDEKVFTGALADLDVDLGTWEPEEERSYEFSAHLPDTDRGRDDDFQGSAVTATFVWSAVQAQ